MAWPHSTLWPQHERRNLSEDCEENEGAHQPRDGRERQQPGHRCIGGGWGGQYWPIYRAVWGWHNPDWQRGWSGREHQKGAAGLQEEQKGAIK